MDEKAKQCALRFPHPRTSDGTPRARTWHAIKYFLVHHRSIPFDFEIKFGDAVGNIDAFFSISQLSIGFFMGSGISHSVE